MTVYYNEVDPFAAAWLRELMKAGQIPDGEVDERSIELVRPDDVRGFGQCHFFAGIGGWAYALKLAGWPDDREVWTGSCPCQPFSSAGAQAGGHDPRDLWPVWFEFWRECRPCVVFGEQVEAAIKHGWLDRVCADVEPEGYALGAVSLPAAGVGAFHIRQRLWFVADRDGSRCPSRRAGEARDGRDAPRIKPAGLRDAGALADDDEAGRVFVGLDRLRENGDALAGVDVDRCGEPGRLEHADRGRSGRLGGADDRAQAAGAGTREATRRVGDRVEPAGAARELGDADGSGLRRGGRSTSSITHESSYWSVCDWLPCADGKARPVEPGTYPVAHGVSARVGRLRGYGNAIVPQVAQVFIEAYLDMRLT